MGQGKSQFTEEELQDYEVMLRNVTCSCYIFVTSLFTFMVHALLSE